MKHPNHKILLSALIGFATGCTHIDEKHAQDTLNEAKRAYQQASIQNDTNHRLSQAAELINKAEQAQEPEEREKWARLAQEKIQAMMRQQGYKTSSQQVSPKPIVEKVDDNRPQSWQDILTAFKHREISQGWVLILENSHFEGNHLLPVVQSKLNRLAVFLKQNPKHLLSIESYTDNFGDRLYSLGLSQRIAEEVRLILLQRGISSPRITVKSFVKEAPSRKSIPSPNYHVDLIVSGETFR